MTSQVAQHRSSTLLLNSSHPCKPIRCSVLLHRVFWPAGDEFAMMLQSGCTPQPVTEYKGAMFRVSETFAEWDVKYPSLSRWEKMHYSTRTRAPTPSWLSMFTCIDEAYLNWPCWTGIVRQLMWCRGLSMTESLAVKVVKNGAKSRFK